MKLRIGIFLIGCGLVASTASAQKVEVSINGGYTASEGITSAQPPLIGQRFDRLGVDSGTSFNLTFGAFLNEQAQAEFLWGRQTSQLNADGPGGKLPVSEMTIYNYMFNFVYNWGEKDTRVRPFLFGGVGASNYSFGQNLLVGSTGDINSETRFSSNWGGGVKFYFSPNVGARVGLRWTPTYIKSDPAGVWCDPFYGCWQVVNNQYSNQFDTSAGITFRF